MIKRLLIALAATVLALYLTGPKLYKMAQISGRLPGAETRQVVVSQKWHQTAAEHPRQRDVYWVAWGETDVRTVGHHRLNFERERWDAISVGDPLELVVLPGGERPYARDGIFASKGNFVIDLVLLVGEIAVALWAFGTILLELRK